VRGEDPGEHVDAVTGPGEEHPLVVAPEVTPPRPGHPAELELEAFPLHPVPDAQRAHRERHRRHQTEQEEHQEQHLDPDGRCQRSPHSGDRLGWSEDRAGIGREGKRGTINPAGFRYQG
jgi:hypothetical protein